MPDDWLSGDSAIKRGIHILALGLSPDEFIRSSFTVNHARVNIDPCRRQPCRMLEPFVLSRENLRGATRVWPNVYEGRPQTRWSLPG